VGRLYSREIASVLLISSEQLRLLLNFEAPEGID